MNDKINILIAEGSDHFWNRSLLEKISFVHIMQSAESGAEAINICRFSRPDMVFIEMILPDMTGLEAARWIRENDKDIKIILFSFELRREFLDACIDTGVNGYLWKCSDLPTIENAIHSVLHDSFFTHQLAV